LSSTSATQWSTWTIAFALPLFHDLGWYSTMSKPTAITQSASSTATAGQSRCPSPIVKRQSGSDGGNAPLPMNVLSTGIPFARANARRLSEARFRSVPLPVRITGNFALRITSAASATACGDGALRRTGRGGIGCASDGCLATSSGRSMWHAPYLSVVATWNALRTISGIESAESTDAPHFTVGRKSATRSMAWWDSLCRRVVAAWPVSTMHGARSMCASPTPVRRLVAPGPSVPRQHAALPVRRPYTSAMNAAACSWRHTMNRTFDSSSEIITSAFSSPGTPKMYSQPSFSRHRTNRSDAFMPVPPVPRPV
jgi:hypothetical protein